MVSKLSTKEIRQFINANNIARLGCNDGERTYVVPINYLYFDSYFLCYSLDGLKIEMMRDHPLVCLEIDEILGLNNWTTVLAFGRYEEIEDPEGKADAKKYFTDSYIRMKAQQNFPSPEAMVPTEEFHHKDIVYYRIQIEELSGRYSKKL